MITDDQALVLASNWCEAWNSHDLDRIMSHYADDVEFSSPFIVRLMGDATGTVRGRDALRGYFAIGLSAYPDLRFELISVAAGISSVVVYYLSVKGMHAFEVMTIDPAGKFARVAAHYRA